MNVNKIKARMKELGYIQDDVSKELGMYTSTLNRKLNKEDGYYLSILEAQKIINFLKIPEEETGAYFFSKITYEKAKSKPKKLKRR